MSEWQMDGCRYLDPVKVEAVRSRYLERLMREALQELAEEDYEL